MITGKVDYSLGLARLEREFEGFRKEISSGTRWYFRERYIDRCMLDPFYLLEFRTDVDDRGDDLYDQELFATPYPYLRCVCMTREKRRTEGSYWEPIHKDDLAGRLERFMTLYKLDCLQPPGCKGDVFDSKSQHEVFREKRFLFEIRSPRRGIIGVGPKKYAGVARTGAVCGQVTDESGTPLDDAVVELVSREGARSRKTADGGLFWFSKVPGGDYRIRVRGLHCIVQVIKQEEFGNIEGWLVDQDGNPVTNAELKFQAPDGEMYNAWSNESGKFTTGPLPAFPVAGSPLSRFPYIMRIPDFLFTIQAGVSVINAAIGGTLRDEQGMVLAKKTVVLKQHGKEISRTETDTKGNFLFDGLLGGRYQIEVPGHGIYARQVLGGDIEGRVPGVVRLVTVELIAKGKVLKEERTTSSGTFGFKNAPPGRYQFNINGSNSIYRVKG